jgi:light-regulated signal transduction histidine kinase (bacteriophytochrome)
VKGFNQNLLGQQFDPGGEPHANFTLNSMEPIIVEDIHQEKRFKPSPLHVEYGLVSGITSVIYGDKTPFGVLQADTQEKRVFTSEDIYFIQALANILGLVIERKEAEDTLKVYRQKLEQSNKELEQFAAVASHDLKAPLRKITAFSNALQEVDGDNISHDGKDYLGRIKKSAGKMQMLITDLLTLSSATSHGKPFRSIHLRDVMSDVLADLEPYIQDVHGTVEVGELCAINGDEIQLNQMLQNLIANALKFHRENVPPIVKVNATLLPNGSCEIKIEDNGIGLKMEHADKIFNPFERLHGPQSYEGTGIGLAVVKKIVERHNGTVRVDSNMGVGSTFTVIFPINIY